MSIYNNDLYNILEEDDDLLGGDEEGGGDDVHLNELTNIVGQIRKDYVTTMTELIELRQIVYNNVHHLSEKAIGDYAEIGFNVSNKFIRRYGVYIMMSDLMKACQDHIPFGEYLRMLPSFKVVDEHYVVTILCTTTVDINFSKICTKISEYLQSKDNIILFVEHQSSPHVINSYQQCLSTFESEYQDFLGDLMPLHYEIGSNGDCEIKRYRMELEVFKQ